ncbi:hypothetical protein KAFR_0A03930 [Kazachstania africana CBS 2517]|uniref:Polynucleotide 5'-hydroxyl-kinase GRC3 n=1 Tax=Kazachstania africana (strain ATCC 22294 / BCRC 22015 / CBS 2517 / CECT 1963 / NBRC 1671 / NRRL Y-8276) TaxID=1071382 RepID=H2AN78_KAZAF|nr:hypothetical protein KAFR_0A03930 [Kazachstania africana CBS 2517]CCF55828.1 hypothetical protein KAFR_0A03930 [Kazachstania africana CBS 2517]
MSLLPGINEATEPLELVNDSNEVHSLAIPIGSQWKVDLPSDFKLAITIKSGIAEVLGTELANDTEYHFQNWKFTVFAVEDVELSWKCTQSLQPKIESNNTASQIYNLHFALEKVRNSSFYGPKVLIIGERNSGKTSLCRILSSYTIKFKSYQPLLINLDPNESIFSPPGCLTATPISDLLDPQSPSWGQSMTSGATALHSKQPYVENFGMEKISSNKQRYMSNIEQLASAVNKRITSDALVQRSGCIIDSPSLDQYDDNLDDLEQIIQRLNVNMVVIICDDDGLYQKVNNRVKPIIGDLMIRLPKLSGVIETDDVYKRSLQRSAIREYFYGNIQTVLSPFTAGVDYNELTIWAPRDLTYDTSAGKDEALELLPVTLEASTLQHAIIAITYADKNANKEEVSKASIMGFGLITEVNEKRQKMRILLPVPGRFPHNAAILTSSRYLE